MIFKKIILMATLLSAPLSAMAVKTKYCPQNISVTYDKFEKLPEHVVEEEYWESEDYGGAGLGTYNRLDNMPKATTTLSLYSKKRSICHYRQRNTKTGVNFYGQIFGSNDWYTLKLFYEKTIRRNIVDSYILYTNVVLYQNSDSPKVNRIKLREGFYTEVYTDLHVWEIPDHIKLGDAKETQIQEIKKQQIKGFFENSFYNLYDGDLIDQVLEGIAQKTETQNSMLCKGSQGYKMKDVVKDQYQQVNQFTVVNKNQISKDNCQSLQKVQCKSTFKKSTNGTKNTYELTSTKCS